MAPISPRATSALSADIRVDDPSEREIRDERVFFLGDNPALLEDKRAFLEGVDAPDVVTEVVTPPAVVTDVVSTADVVTEAAPAAGVTALSAATRLLCAGVTIRAAREAEGD
jgi:hypothetical protein